MHDEIITKHGLPTTVSVDLAQPLFIGFYSIPSTLCTIKAILQSPVEKRIGYLASVKDVIRMSTVNTTLNGLPPEDEPMIAKEIYQVYFSSEM